MSNLVASVEFETLRFVELRRRIREIEPDLDEQTLDDTLDGCSDLKELIVALVDSAIEDATMASATRQRIDDLKDRLFRFEHRETQKREIALSAMEAAGLAKVIGTTCTISLRPAPSSLKIIDEHAVPEWFWVPQPAKLDRIAVLNALKSGTVIAGVEISAPRQVLSVRTR